MATFLYLIAAFYLLGWLVSLFGRPWWRWLARLTMLAVTGVLMLVTCAWLLLTQGPGYDATTGALLVAGLVALLLAMAYARWRYPHPERLRPPPDPLAAMPVLSGQRPESWAR